MEKLKSSCYASVNGLNMYYEIHGEGGLPLVLIHGGGSTIESSFGNILPLLSRYGQVIAVELQAHGRSGDRDTPESFEQDADDVVALLEFPQKDKANFLGFSNGGTTTLQIAIRHPAVVNKIMVVSAGYKREGMIPGFFEGLRNATLEDMPAPLKTAFLSVTPDKNLLQRMFEKDRERMLTFKDLSDDELRAIQAATLLLAGDRDVVTVEHILQMAKLLPSARMAILTGNHGSIIGEICTEKKGSRLPEMTTTLIEEFLSE
jgi:pimeloyl-ACP methyl ester carboxylesterase